MVIWPYDFINVFLWRSSGQHQVKKLPISNYYFCIKSTCFWLIISSEFKICHQFCSMMCKKLTLCFFLLYIAIKTPKYLNIGIFKFLCVRIKHVVLQRIGRFFKEFFEISDYWRFFYLSRFWHFKYQKSIILKIEYSSFVELFIRDMYGAFICNLLLNSILNEFPNSAFRPKSACSDATKIDII